MSKILTQYLEKLAPHERAKLEALAKEAGFTVEEWVEFSTKAQIYRGAEELLCGKVVAP